MVKKNAQSTKGVVEKKRKWNTPLINLALKKYSPFGLCAETLIRENGDPKKTIACTTGALFIHALDKDARTRRAFWKSDETCLFEGERDLHNAVDLSKGAGSPSSFGDDVGEAVEAFYDMPKGALTSLIHLNDSIEQEYDLSGFVCRKGCRCEGCTIARKEARLALATTKKRYSGKGFVGGIPKKIARTVYSLRQKYERLYKAGKLPR